MVDPATAAMIGSKALGAGVGLIKEIAGNRLQKAATKSLLDRNKIASHSPQNLGITDKAQRLAAGKEEIGTGINAQMRDMARQNLSARGAGQQRGAESQMIEGVATGTGKAVADLSGKLESADIKAEKADVMALDSAMARQQQIEAGNQARQAALLQQTFAGIGEAGKEGVGLAEGMGKVKQTESDLW